MVRRRSIGVGSGNSTERTGRRRQRSSQCAFQSSSHTASRLPRISKVLAWPSVAVRSDTAFVAGNVVSGDSLIARPAYLGHVRQKDSGDLIPLAPLELPVGDFQFAYPRIALAGSTLHLVWAEFESPHGR